MRPTSVNSRHGGLRGGRTGLREQAGLSVIEFLTALTIAAVLVGIAIPAYREFTDRAVAASAQSTLRAAVPAIEFYFVDNGTYAGITYEHLRDNYAAELGPLTFVGADDNSYCVEATRGDETYSQDGPGAPIREGGCGSGSGGGDPSEVE